MLNQKVIADIPCEQLLADIYRTLNRVASVKAIPKFPCWSNPISNCVPYFQGLLRLEDRELVSHTSDLRGYPYEVNIEY